MSACAAATGARRWAIAPRPDGLRKIRRIFVNDFSAKNLGPFDNDGPHRVPRSERADQPDIAGRQVKVLLAGEVHEPGVHQVVWNGRDDNGRRVSSGTYFYRLNAGSFSHTNRMTLVK